MQNKSIVPDGGKKAEITEALGFGMLLAAMGGFMDAYSYTVRGRVFATGQTGNLVLGAFSLAKQDFKGLGHAMVPIVAFWIGIFAAQHLSYILNEERIPRPAAPMGICKEASRRKPVYVRPFRFPYTIFQKKRVKWKAVVLFAELMILFGVGLLPCSVPDILANTGISLSAAMQYSSFRTFGESAAYAPIFCTGNMRSCAEMFYKWIVGKDKGSMKKAFHYTAILIAFFSGAVFGVKSSGIYREKAIWFVCALLGLALFILHKYSAGCSGIGDIKEPAVKDGPGCRGNG